MYSIKLQRSSYGLKLIRQTWYNCLSEYLLKEGYKNDPIYPCVFIKKFEFEFVIIMIYVDDLNIIKTHEELPKAFKYLKKKMEIKDLEKIRFRLGLQIKHSNDKIFVYQSNYIKKVLKHFYIDKSYPLSTLMVIQ